ncbi:hypothetical protein BS50DRAFT_617447 [Corynespora cassiicola Philippines]|uniref:Gfd2/YDR514C-like C-terminal domain-containing protein n=1 Tax=Corynespora cassiicola Philippines TaxID=1448308 RepID=A0A2T2P3L7_CORCC|nr:hypothetical protein BS50DRAFT_617447 [Corynespora cassiicola Philippines]
MQQKEAQELIARTLGPAQGFDLGDIVFFATGTEWGAYFPKTHKAYNKLTEVGLASLDTRDLRDVETRRNGHYWLDKLRAVHYLLSGAADIKSIAENNHVIALHAAHHFEFGNTTIVDRDQLAGALLQDFKIIDGKSPGIPLKYRQIIFIGHGWNKMYERNLKDNGLDIWSVDKILAIVDSQLLHRHPGATSLGPRLDKLLDQYNCSPLHVNNGANDAVYMLVTVILGVLWDNAWREQKDGS